MDNHTGSCHCGEIQFTANTDLNNSFKCNCSFCVRRAATMHKVEVDAFHLHCDESKLGVYGNRDFSKHYFCKNCGIHCFTRVNRASGNAVMINTGCLQGVDSLALTPSLFDGANKL